MYMLREVCQALAEEPVIGLDVENVPGVLAERGPEAVDCYRYSLAQPAVERGVVANEPHDGVGAVLTARDRRIARPLGAAHIDRRLVHLERVARVRLAFLDLLVSQLDFEGNLLPVDFPVGGPLQKQMCQALRHGRGPCPLPRFWTTYTMLS